MFSVLQDSLKKALREVGRAIDNKASFAALAGVMIETLDGIVRLTGTNWDTTTHYTFTAKIQEPMKALVNFADFKKLVDNMPAERMDVSLSGDKLVLSCGKVSASVNTMDTDDYPDMYTVTTTGDSIIIDSETLLTVLTEVLPYIANDDIRPVLNSACMQMINGVLFVDAADGYRLNRAETRKALGDSEFIAMPILAGLKNVIAGLKAEKTVQDVVITRVIIAGIESVEFETKRGKFIMRHTPGRFPDVASIIPVLLNQPIEGKVLPAELLKATKTVAVLADKVNGTSTLKFDGDNLSLSATSKENGESTVSYSLECAFKQAGQDEINLNYTYLQDLSKTKAESITIYANGPTRPVPFAYTIGETYFTVVIMPISKGR